MAEAKLIISPRNYSSWALRGWLMAKFAGLDFEEEMTSPDDPATRAELLLLSPSFLVPSLIHGDVRVWDTLAIGEYLNEIKPKAGLLPTEKVARAHCRSICGEMHSGFRALRSALPVNLRAFYPGYQVYTGVKQDIDRILTIWRECLQRYGGPYLFGARRTMADAMYAPVVTRFKTYDVKLEGPCASYAQQILAMPEMKEWTDAALLEPDEPLEFEAEF